MRTILAFDIGGTKTAVLEGTTEAEILQRIEMPTLAEVPFEERFLVLAESADSVIEASESAGRQIVATSVSIGGPLKIQPGELINPPHLPGWHGVALKKRLEARFPKWPVFVEHDGNAGALAEFYFGVGRLISDLQHLVFLTFGTGIGAGIIVNGQVLHGASDTAGEIGHWRLSETGPIGFGKAGSWTGFASGSGLVELATRKNARRWPEGTAIRNVVESMLADDEEALAVAEEAGFWMGRGLALIVDALNPQVIVLGSLAVVLGDRILVPAMEALRADALPQAVDACRIVPAALGDAIGDVAALMAARVRMDV